MAWTCPFDNVTAEQLTLDTADGPTAMVRCRPKADGRYPAIVIGAEAFGINDHMRTLAARLASLGYATVLVDYYYGNGLAHPDNGDDLTEVMEAIGRLDFRKAIWSQLHAIDHARSLPYVRPDKVATWGYCTGATLSMAAACLDRQLSAAILFFPSQPVFEGLEARLPNNPIDLLWNLRCPVQFHYGDEDAVLPPEVRAELMHRLDTWGVDYEFLRYPGAQHAFASIVPALYDATADTKSWEAATAFAARHLAG